MTKRYSEDSIAITMGIDCFHKIGLELKLSLVDTQQIIRSTSDAKYRF